MKRDCWCRCPSNKLPINCVVLQRYDTIKVQSNNKKKIHEYSIPFYEEIKPI